MKKLFLSLLLTTTIIPLSCMEQEKPKSRTNYEVQFPAVSSSTISPSQPQTHCLPVYCEANQPGWQQLDAIANMTYQRNPSHITQSSTTDEFELKPIYKTANATITQQEKIPLLQTNSLQPDDTIMQNLYNSAATIIRDQYDEYSYYQCKIHNDLRALINAMNRAKNNGISEDLMGDFAYKQKKEHNARVSKCSCVNIAPLVPIMFVLLKKYNTSVCETRESSPSFNIINVGNHIDKYPAFFKLHYTLCCTIETIALDKIKAFTQYIYENNDISEEGYSDGSYKDLNNEFYATAYNYLFSEKSLNNLYSLLQTINKAKELREIHDENDLITYIDPVNKPAKGQLFGWFSPTHSDDNVKNRITLLCKLIKKYNTARDYKLTPTIAQYNTYYVQKFINVPLPEPICNNTHLDDTFYAFKEFEELRINAEKLIKLTIDKVNEQIRNLNK